MTGVDYFWLERLQASAIMEACRAAKAVCIDFGGNIDFEPPKDFYDPFHTSPSGSARIAAFLYHRLQQLP